MMDLYNYVVDEFIPNNIKRKLVDNILDSDTLEYYYIDSDSINSLEFDDDVKDEIIKIILNLNIKIISNSDEKKYTANSKRFIIDIDPSVINDKIRLMNSYNYHSKEYLKIRNEIFSYYIDYPNHIVHKYINKYHISYEDATNDIYVFMLEAIEQFDFSNFFSTFMSFYISKKFAIKYKIAGAGILLSENIYNNSKLKTVDSEYLAFSFFNYLNREEIDENVADVNSSMDVYFDEQESKWFRDLIISFILHLEEAPSAKRKTKANMDRYKKLLIVYYGINTGKKLSVKQCAKYFGKKEKWVNDNLFFARKFFAEMVLIHNMNASEEEKIYVY